ncbi:unnamed protein product, partial [Mesorhabditis belari]|uniref:Alpha-mannosidase n=1 Tax=Mesorhabditis belari TaxID=2138241 RepID=A0AAF3EYW1_9BILA
MERLLYHHDFLYRTKRSRQENGKINTAVSLKMVIRRRKSLLVVIVFLSLCLLLMLHQKSQRNIAEVFRIETHNHHGHGHNGDVKHEPQDEHRDHKDVDHDVGEKKHNEVHEPAAPVVDLEISDEHGGPPYLLGKLETIDSPVEAKHAIYQSYEEEMKAADYHSNDIFNTMQKSGQATGNRAVPPQTKEKLEVFLLPFTHVDPGWLRTFDSYSEETDKILNNVYEFMSQEKHKTMRFLWAEFVFFERWWAKQNDTVKTGVKKLVSDGHLELASGSWVMTDEANAYFPVSVDNIVEGHQYLNTEFGKVPSTVWSNDPFGYSHSVPYLFVKAGVKRTVINRIHHPMKRWLQGQKAIPFHWRQYFDKNGNDEMFTQILPYTHYDIPNSCGPDSGVCCQFDFRRMTQWGCGGTNPVPITSENVRSKASTFVDELKRMSNMYESNVLLVMHGDDFRFELMSEWHQQFDNLQPLFDEINKGDDVKIRFGTFNDYFTAQEKWYKDKKKTPAKIAGDFFPYQCAMGTYWTGYFTTRPFYKRQGRLLHSTIHAVDSFLVLKWSSISPVERKEYVNTMTKARRVLLLFQHHDAITGTSKKSVMKDYSIQLFNALTSVNELLKKLQDDFQVIQKPTEYNQTLSTAVLKVYTGKPLTISVFNQLPYQRAEVLTLRVSEPDVAIMQNGKVMRSQVEPYIQSGHPDNESYTIAFEVMLLPMSRSLFTLLAKNDITRKGQNKNITPTEASLSISPLVYDVVWKALPSLFSVTASKLSFIDGIMLESDRLKTEHNVDGSIKKVYSPTATNEPISFNQTFVRYENAHGGAYILSSGSKPGATHSIPNAKVILVKGPIRQVLYVLGEQDVIQQSYTINNLLGSAGERIHWKILLDITKRKNFELGVRFDSALNVNTTWHYTDSVGLQLIKRAPYHGHEVGSDYYPMPTAVVMDDRALRLTIASNVEHGAMFPKNGSVEIMLDRMLNQDDGKGLGSADDGIPDDLLPVEMEFTLLFEQVTEKKRSEHLSYNSLGGHLSLLTMLYPPLLMAAAGEQKDTMTGIPQLVLPCEYQLISMRRLSLPSEAILIVIHRSGIDVGSASMVHCITNGLKGSIREFLEGMGATKVVRTNLSGVKVIGKDKEDTIDKVDLDVAVMDFLVLKKL